MNIEDLQKQWSNLSFEGKKFEDDNRKVFDRIASGKALSFQKRLANTFLLTTCLGLLLPCLAPALVYMLNIPVWEAILYALFGIIMSAANFCLRRYIIRTDFIHYPVVMAIEKAISIRGRIRLIRFLGFCLGLPIVLSLGMELTSGSEGTVCGFVIGIVLGLILGIFKWRKQSKLTRSLLDELKTCRED